MSLLDTLGGFGGIAKLMSDPGKLPALVASNAPGATHTLARMRMLQEIAARASVLSTECHNILFAVLASKTDVPPEVLASLDKMQLELVKVCSQLHNFPKAQNVTLEHLQSLYRMAPQAGAPAGDSQKQTPSA